MEATNNNEEIKKEADSLSEDIKKSEKRLEEIQEQCNHSESKITNVSKGGQRATYKLVCTTCNREVGYPSPDELEDFLKG